MSTVQEKEHAIAKFNHHSTKLTLSNPITSISKKYNYSTTTATNSENQLAKYHSQPG